MNFSAKKYAFLIFILMIHNLHAKSLEDFYLNFKSGQYQKALESLNKMEADEGTAASKNYLIGITHSRLQEYDKAVVFFEKAIKLNSDAKDLQYEYGQALYANNDLRKSREAFSKSHSLKFNSPASLYYVGHISQILEDYEGAKKAYTELVRNKEIDKKMEQISKFQLTETYLSLLRINNSDKNKMEVDVDKKILPMFKFSFDVDKNSTISQEINKRIKEVQKEFNLDPDLLKNGRHISPKRLNAYVDLKTKFDDNVTNSNLENDIQQSHKESYYIEAESEVRYDYVIKKKFITTPVFRITADRYTNQDEPTVFLNDSTILNGSLKNKFEHTVKNAPASFIFDFDYAKTFKDYLKVHSIDSYSNAKTFTIGEQASLSSRGDTTFKFKYKDFSGYSDTLNNHTTTISVDQSLALPNSNMLIVLVEADLTNNYNTPNTNTNSYMLRFDYVLPEILPKYNLTVSFTTTLVDTLQLKSTRGFETTLNPSIELSKDLSDKIKGVISVDYTRNKSKSADYTYQKYVTNMELKYSF